MKRYFLLSPVAFFLFSCAQTPEYSTTFYPSPESGLRAKSSFLLTQMQRDKIARKIWNNESAGKVSGLTAWNVGEEFPSLGIGHFIWYPRGVQGPFTESFPQFIKFAQQKGLTPPQVALSTDSPWSSRTQFQAQFNSPRMTELRNWLANNLTVQADFIISKSQASLGKIINAAPAADRARVQANYQKVSTTPNGQYALIDYVNFKGEGINPKERYNGEGWGLLQVLQLMGNVQSGQPAAEEFSRAAKRALGRRIDNSDKSRGEVRWKAGWFKRCDTYKKPL